MPQNKSTKETLEEKRENSTLQQLMDNRKKRFIELLGKDCGYIDSLVTHTYVTPWDVKNLLDKGCPNELIPKILI